MKVRIIKEKERKRTYYVMSGDRRHPALASASGVLPEQRSAVKELLIGDVTQRMRPAQPPIGLN